jgi:MoaA/NifB/PqqE/SkfB family radical SAM enzyme
MKDGPKEAIVALTYRCDARCEMCDIWKLEPKEYLTAANYAGLPISIDTVNLTGGEALLRKDFLEIARTIYHRCNKPRIIVSTNGFRSERTVQTLLQARQWIPNIGIGVSLDGMASTHDNVRGAAKAFERATETLRLFKLHGFKDLRIGFTAMNTNVAEMLDVYEYSRTLGVEFSMTIAQNSQIYYGKVDNEPINLERLKTAVNAVNTRELRTANPKRWFRAYFNSGIIRFVEEQSRLVDCRAGIDFFYLAPEGTVYPCLTIPEAMGDLRTQTFDALWCSKQADAVREQINGCQDCWMVCTSRTSLKSVVPAASRWIVGKKIRAHFGIADGAVD